MRFFATVAAAVTLLGAATAHYGKGSESNSTAPASYTTLTVTSLETYCPSATSTVVNGKTYTVTTVCFIPQTMNQPSSTYTRLTNSNQATTLTITDCPCLVSYPVTTSTLAPGSSPAGSPPPASPPATTPTTVIPVPIPSGSAPGVPGNGTGPYVPPVTPAPSAGTPGSPTSVSPPISTFSGAAAHHQVGVGLAGVVAAAAYLL